MSNNQKTPRARVLAGVVAPVLLWALASAPAAAGGSIVGKVTFAGEPPPVESVPISQDTAVCGTEKAQQGLVLGEGNGIRWAIVRIAGATGAGATSEAPSMNQHACEFEPRVVVARPAEAMNMINSDNILHNVHTHSEKNPVLNNAQPGFVKTLAMTFPEAELVKVTCDVHPWMTGWVMVTENPHVAVTDEVGSFTLSDVPAGEHELSLWHETLGQQTKKVKVTDGAEVAVAFELAAP